ncbi:histidine phosphatase family protein [Lacrimispora sphenoides]|uniref:Probable phosphoglycerate mutase n=1 Tax=Lacrimispora sphenoides JCM 1415 TaxID=1297793 RepID=A0ABY1C618_9FIRM|nr:histidine phosphatase family protein [Lacrimispora sphenoides]SET71687.1 probable phosphoglycerate mutase [[Clostridium] sphenoides JCM 1415]SUY50716.1 phosphoglycerate mutase [Lacrimispora sphenoides]
MNIYLIRHGRQNSKLCNIDVDLSEEGRRQSALVGERLASIGMEAVYSSHLIRAVETAREANRYWNAKHIIRQELREISFGDMEGMADEEIAEKYGDFQKEQARLEQDLPYPGGECAGDVMKRAIPVLEEIAASGYQNVAVVTHGGVIRSVTSALLHMEPKYYRLLGNSLENCSITEVHWNEKTGRFLMERFNDYAHLEPYPELLRASWVDAEN